MLPPRFRTVLLSFSIALFALGCTVGSTGPEQSDTSGIDAGADAGDEALGFMEVCVANEDCETGLCYAFNQGGPRCSHSCDVDTDCAEPSQGCNNMGVCKRPDGDNDNSGGADGGV